MQPVATHKHSGVIITSLAFLFAISCMAQQEIPRPNATSRVLKGTDPRGDTAFWNDGSVWTEVTIQEYVGPHVVRGRKQEEEDRSVAKDRPRLKITNVPIGREGWYSDVAGAALRTGERELPPLGPSSSILELCRKGRVDMPAPRNLPVLKAKFEDLCFFKWQPEIEALTFKPEYIGQVQRDGETIGVQSKMTVSHIIIDRARAYFRLRKTVPSSFVEGWYYDIDEVYFSREEQK